MVPVSPTAQAWVGSTAGRAPRRGGAGVRARDPAQVFVAPAGLLGPGAAPPGDDGALLPHRPDMGWVVGGHTVEAGVDVYEAGFLIIPSGAVIVVDGGAVSHVLA